MPLVGLSADERLYLHQTQSDPIMMALKKSMSAQIEEKKLSPIQVSVKPLVRPGRKFPRKLKRYQRKYVINYKPIL
jgi:hypothetical protein